MKKRKGTFYKKDIKERKKKKKKGVYKIKKIIKLGYQKILLYQVIVNKKNKLMQKNYRKKYRN